MLFSKKFKDFLLSYVLIDLVTFVTNLSKIVSLNSLKLQHKALKSLFLKFTKSRKIQCSKQVVALNTVVLTWLKSSDSLFFCCWLGGFDCQKIMVGFGNIENGVDKAFYVNQYISFLIILVQGSNSNPNLKSVSKVCGHF